MGFIYYLNKLTQGLYHLNNGRDDVINWDSDINALQFASSKFEESESYFSFEFENLIFAFFSDYKFYAKTNKQNPINFREIYSEPIDKSNYLDVSNKLGNYLGKPTSIGINSFPSWSNNKICLKLIDFKTEFRISITSEPPVHDYRNETKVRRRYNKEEIIFIPNSSFSFDYIVSMDLKNFIDENINPDTFDFQLIGLESMKKARFVRMKYVLK